MPDIKGAEYLINHLNNLGWCSSNGMGAVSLSFTEIKAYIDTTDTPLTGDEVLLIKRMSQAYVSELNDKNPNKQSAVNIPS